MKFSSAKKDYLRSDAEFVLEKFEDLIREDDEDPNAQEFLTLTICGFSDKQFARMSKADRKAALRAQCWLQVMWIKDEGSATLLYAENGAVFRSDPPTDAAVARQILTSYIRGDEIWRSLIPWCFDMNPVEEEDRAEVSPPCENGKQPQSARQTKSDQDTREMNQRLRRIDSNLETIRIVKTLEAQQKARSFGERLAQMFFGGS